MSTQKTVLGALAGLAVGATLGILFAPQSGKKTRRMIARRGQQAKDELSDLIDEGYEQWSELRNRATDAVSMTKDEVQDFVRYMMKEGRDLKGRITDDVKKTAFDVASNGRKTAEDQRKAAAN